MLPTAIPAVPTDLASDLCPVRERGCPERGWFYLLLLIGCHHHDCCFEGLCVCLCVTMAFGSLKILLTAGIGICTCPSCEQRMAGHHPALAYSMGDLTSCPRGHFSDREPTTPTRRCRWWTSTSPCCGLAHTLGPPAFICLAQAIPEVLPGG